MNKKRFIEIWNYLYDYNERSKKLSKNKTNIMSHDKDLYNCVILLLKTIFNQQEVDLIIFSVFSEDNVIDIEGDDVCVDTAELCYKYLYISLEEK